MPHDRNEKLLAVGDRVVIEGVITSVATEGEDGCNCEVESLHGRRPDELKEKFAINTGVVTLVERAETVDVGQSGGKSEILEGEPPAA